AKPVAKIAYNIQFEDFDFDAVYTKRIQQEQQDVVKNADELRRQREKARLDSLNKIWNDSIAMAKDMAPKLAAELAARQKAQKDSIARALVELKRQEDAAREKARQDSIKLAQVELKKKQDEERLRL